MQKIKFIIILFLALQTAVLANLHDIYIADIQYDWIEKSYKERQVIIEEVKNIIFKDSEITKIENFKSQFSKDILKDKNNYENYLAASAGYKEYKNNNIFPFYFKNQKNIYMYALQNKEDLTKIYYYSALGKLRFVDFVSDNYPEYPYYSIQYKINGEPISLIYFSTKDTQYVYNPDGTFKGLWHKYNMYDENSKIISTRTSY